MKHFSHSLNYAGDAFSRYKAAAQFYCHRPRWGAGFIKLALETASDEDFSKLRIADCGAGDGGPGRVMIEVGCDPNNIFQVEPNEEMRRLNREKGGLNVVQGTASDTHLPPAKFHILTYFNSAHQLPKAEANKIRRENQRILKPNGKIIIAAQRFDSNSKLIQDIDSACDDWKIRGLYPDYGDNGHRFILNSESGADNAKAILNECSHLYIAEESPQEIAANNQIQYDKPAFTGLFRSYLSFPTSPAEKLMQEIEDLHDKHANNDGIVTIHCTQVAKIGAARAMEKEQGAGRF